VTQYSLEAAALLSMRIVAMLSPEESSNSPTVASTTPKQYVWFPLSSVTESEAEQLEPPQTVSEKPPAVVPSMMYPPPITSYAPSSSPGELCGQVIDQSNIALSPLP
jgi:hypothetical protein